MAQVRILIKFEWKMNYYETQCPLLQHLNHCGLWVDSNVSLIENEQIKYMNMNTILLDFTVDIRKNA